MYVRKISENKLLNSHQTNNNFFQVSKKIAPDEVNQEKTLFKTITIGFKTIATEARNGTQLLLNKRQEVFKCWRELINKILEPFGGKAGECDDSVNANWCLLWKLGS